MRSTLLDMDSRLRVACATEKDETQASMGVFRILQRRGHLDGAPQQSRMVGAELTKLWWKSMVRRRNTTVEADQNTFSAWLRSR
jgi:ribosomal protein S3AE